jgi:hypothetical protein
LHKKLSVETRPSGRFITVDGADLERAWSHPAATAMPRSSGAPTRRRPAGLPGRRRRTVGARARLLSKFERYKLTFGPTPIEKLFRLTAQIFAKREDCNSGLAYGGNKLRKLEYIVPDVIASNADTLVGAMR